jgi:hypothetical protein
MTRCYFFPASFSQALTVRGVFPKRLLHASLIRAALMNLPHTAPSGPIAAGLCAHECRHSLQHRIVSLSPLPGAVCFAHAAAVMIIASIVIRMNGFIAYPPIMETV